MATSEQLNQALNQTVSQLANDFAGVVVQRNLLASEVAGLKEEIAKLTTELSEIRKAASVPAVDVGHGSNV